MLTAIQTAALAQEEVTLTHWCFSVPWDDFLLTSQSWLYMHLPAIPGHSNFTFSV